MRLIFLTFFIFLQFTFLSAQGDQLFDDSQLHEIRFELVDTTIFIASKEYQSVNMWVDGVLLDSVGFKKKGNISAFHPNHKFPFKVKTNKYMAGATYDGIKEFTLHNNFDDPSLLREKMTYDLLADLELHSLRTAFAKVYINDQYWGLYTLLEGKDEMYKHIFDNRDGAVLESNDFGDMCYEGPNKEDYYHDLLEGYPYEIDNGEEAFAWANFLPMLDKANNTSADEYLAVVSNYLNIRDFFTYQAANVYLLNFDSYIAFRGNQLYYFNELTNVWEVIPWDFNASFGLWNTNNARPFDYPMLPPAISNGCIASKVNEVQEVADIYNGAMCQLIHELADTNRMIGLIDQWRTQIEEAVYDDHRKDLTNERFDEATEYGYFEHGFEEFVPGMKTFVVDRWAFITQQIGLTNIDCSSITTSTEEVLSIPASLSIFPNPARQQINIRCLSPANQGIKQVVLFNTAGQVIQSLDSGGQGQLSIDLSQHHAGFYWLKVYFSDGTFLMRKIVKIE